MHVRILCTGEIFGAYFHYTRREGSRPCQGDACQCKGKLHGAEWKGFVPAEEWVGGASAWIPGALEITENCALEMTGRVERGQLWVLSRPPKSPGKAGKVSALLSELRDPATLRPPFDVGPILYHLFRCGVVLDKRCHVPPKPVMEVSTDAGPPAAIIEGPRVATPEEIRAKLRAAGIPEPTPNGNGRRTPGPRYT